MLVASGADGGVGEVVRVEGGERGSHDDMQQATEDRREGGRHFQLVFFSGVGSSLVRSDGERCRQRRSCVRAV